MGGQLTRFVSRSRRLQTFRFGLVVAVVVDVDVSSSARRQVVDARRRRQSRSLLRDEVRQGRRRNLGVGVSGFVGGRCRTSTLSGEGSKTTPKHLVVLVAEGCKWSLCTSNKSLGPTCWRPKTVGLLTTSKSHRGQWLPTATGGGGKNFKNP